MEDTSYILIAEDDEDDQFLLKSAFNEVAKNITLVFVDNGIELVNHFNKFDEGLVKTLPSLLIIDLNMPKKNGREAIKELLVKDYFRNFSTIIFSTTSNDTEKNKCKELGILDFFVKPANYQTLLTMVAEFKSLAGI